MTGLLVLTTGSKRPIAAVRDTQTMIGSAGIADGAPLLHGFTQFGTKEPLG